MKKSQEPKNTPPSADTLSEDFKEVFVEPKKECICKKYLFENKEAMSINPKCPFHGESLQDKECKHSWIQDTPIKVCYRCGFKPTTPEREKYFKTATVGGKTYKLNKKGIGVDLSKTPPEVITTPEREQDWVKEFDKTINGDYLRGASTGKQLVGIKAFIKSLLSSQKKKMAEKIEGQKISWIKGIKLKQADRWKHIVNAVLDTILKELKD